MITTVIRTCFPAAAKVVAEKADEINKLNSHKGCKLMTSCFCIQPEGVFSRRNYNGKIIFFTK